MSAYWGGVGGKAPPHYLYIFSLYILFFQTYRKLVSVSSPGATVHYILQWLLESVCEPPHWKHGPCTKCSVAFGSIASLSPAFNSLTLL